MNTAQDVTSAPEGGRLKRAATCQSATAPSAAQQQKVAASQTSATTNKAEYSMSAGLIRRLSDMNAALAFTSYQSGFVYMLGSNAQGNAQLHQSGMPKPMGLSCTSNGGIVLATGAQVIHFANVLEPDQRINQTYDACFMPRTTHLTGQLDAHDIGEAVDGELVFVNTRYNCISTTSKRHAFELVWKPDFITEIVDEDRCHLNGMAMKDGIPAYATAVSRSNTIDGWRDRRADGGVVIDIASNTIVCDGLSMPHSPRWHDGKLWVLNSGTGELGFVDFSEADLDAEKGEPPKKGAFKPVAFCPGFVRGLTFHGKFAFVGLSRPRYKRFEGLALDARLNEADSEPWCGVQVIDTLTGACVDWFRIDGEIGELFDVELIEGARCPMAVSPTSVDAATLITFDQDMLRMTSSRQ